MNRFICSDLTEYSSCFSNNRYYYELFLRFLCNNRKLKEICNLVFYEVGDYYKLLDKLPRRQRTPKVIDKFVGIEMKKYDENRSLLDCFCYPVDDNIDMIRENLVIYLKKNNLKLPRRIFDILLASSLIDIYLDIAYSISFEIYSSDWWEVIDEFLSIEGRKDRNKLYSILIDGMNLRYYSNDMVRKILGDLHEQKNIQFDSEKYNKPIDIRIV